MFNPKFYTILFNRYSLLANINLASIKLTDVFVSCIKFFSFCELKTFLDHKIFMILFSYNTLHTLRIFIESTRLVWNNADYSMNIEENYIVS